MQVFRRHFHPEQSFFSRFSSLFHNPHLSLSFYSEFLFDRLITSFPIQQISAVLLLEITRKNKIINERIRGAEIGRQARVRTIVLLRIAAVAVRLFLFFIFRIFMPPHHRTRPYFVALHLKADVILLSNGKRLPLSAATERLVRLLRSKERKKERKK